MNSKCIPMFVAPVFVQIDHEHPDCTVKTSCRITDIYIKHFYTGSVRFYQECTLVAAEYNHGPHKTLGAQLPMCLPYQHALFSFCLVHVTLRRQVNGSRRFDFFILKGRVELSLSYLTLTLLRNVA